MKIYRIHDIKCKYNEWQAAGGPSALAAYSRIT